MTLAQLVAIFFVLVLGIVLLLLAVHIVELERRVRIVERRRAEELVAWLERRASDWPERIPVAMSRAELERLGIREIGR